MPDAHDHRRDRELLARVLSGDAPALADLYDGHGASLFRHALALARRRADAEDLVQAVFLKLASSGTELLGVRTPAAYLHRMLHTIWIDQERRRITGERLVDRADAATREAASVGGEWTLDLARALDALPAALAMNRRQSSWQADYAGNGALPPWLAIRRLSQVLYISARIAVASSRPEDASARIATGLAVAASIR